MLQHLQHNFWHSQRSPLANASNIQSLEPPKLRQSGETPSMEQTQRESSPVLGLDYYNNLDLELFGSLFDHPEGTSTDSPSADSHQTPPTLTPSSNEQSSPTTANLSPDKEQSARIAATNFPSISVPSSDTAPAIQSDIDSKHKQAASSPPTAQRRGSSKALNNSEIIKSALFELFQNDQQPSSSPAPAQNSSQTPKNPTSGQKKRKRPAFSEASPGLNGFLTDPSQRATKQLKGILKHPATDTNISLAQHASYYQQPGASQANPVVLDDECNSTPPPQHASTTTKPSTTDPPAPKRKAVATATDTATAAPPAPNPKAAAFAIQETIPLSIGGKAHRTFAFSPAFNVAVRHEGKLISILKEQPTRHVLHFVNKPNSGGGGNKDGSSSADDGSHPFKVVGFGPCVGCSRRVMTGILCDRGLPCGHCAAAGVECLLPIVERPAGAIDGDELLERDAKGIVTPGMAVVEKGGAALPTGKE